MTVEPLRTETARHPGVARPAQRPAGHQMCVVVAEVADGDGSALVANLRRRGNQRVVVLTRRASRAELGVMLAGGLRGAVASATAPSVVRTPPPPVPPSDLPELTAREVSVLRLVADGRSNKLIGEELGLSALTVKSHLARISRKFGTGDRAELVAISIRGGILD
ncbi:LuxR C-terminal-related transcriptional regulator [Cellulomonas sp. HZM]|uniref:helix-turn-helix transcriptional regulator n=1 Tax=Cellulomonas sp. HZM TaxID=1454010 RepID=UPI000B27558E|nr:LuxR C-terminal-related transcriptional regulator [Cellulomonas sp. HZM]